MGIKNLSPEDLHCLTCIIRKEEEDKIKLKTIKLTMTEHNYLSSLRFQLIIGLLAGFALGIMLMVIIQ